MPKTKKKPSHLEPVICFTISMKDIVKYGGRLSPEWYLKHHPEVMRPIKKTRRK